MIEKKRILFLARGLGIGGAQKMLVFVANNCVSAGYNVSIVSLRNQETSLLIDKKISITRFNFLTGNGVRPSLPEKIRIIWTLRMFIKNDKPDLIIAFMSDIVRIAVLSSFNLGIPIIASERGDPLQYSKKTFNKYISAYKKCDAIIFQTERAKQLYPAIIHKKSSVIPNPYLPRLEDIQPFFGQRKNRIIAAGRLDKQKRFDVLIQAFSLVHSKFPDVVLNIYGDGPLYKDIGQLINILNLEDAAVLKGASANFLLEEYDAAMFVLSSDYEGIPNVLLEVMGIGMPCISTDCEPGGPRMLFDNERRGVLVPVGDAEKMAAAICRFIEDPSFAEEKGRKAMEVRTCYSAEAISKTWLDLIDKHVYLASVGIQP